MMMQIRRHFYIKEEGKESILSYFKESKRENLNKRKKPV